MFSVSLSLSYSIQNILESIHEAVHELENQPYTNLLQEEVEEKYNDLMVRQYS